MSYMTAPKSRKGKIGHMIYHEALSHRRGFRDDQLGIEDGRIWNEIFIAIGKAAIEALERNPAQ
jgi:hypothetical protein